MSKLINYVGGRVCLSVNLQSLTKLQSNMRAARANLVVCSVHDMKSAIKLFQELVSMLKKSKLAKVDGLES